MNTTFSWEAPKVLGTADIPEPREPVYADILRQLPDDKAIVLEFPSRKTRAYAGGAIHAIAQQRLLITVSVRSVNTDDGRFLLLVWKRRDCDRRVTHVSTENLPVRIGELELVVAETA